MTTEIRKSDAEGYDSFLPLQLLKEGIRLCDTVLAINGEAAVIHHSGTGIDPELPVNKEIAKATSKKASIRTETEHRRIRELEVFKSLWLDDGLPCIPVSALRSCIETAARKMKQGPLVREGLMVASTDFAWDFERYGDGYNLDDLAKICEFTTPLVVQSSRILRTRAKFDTPWSIEAVIEVDDELIDQDRLSEWFALVRTANLYRRLEARKIRHPWAVQRREHRSGLITWHGMARPCLARRGVARQGKAW